MSFFYPLEPPSAPREFKYNEEKNLLEWQQPESDGGTAIFGYLLGYSKKEPKKEEEKGKKKEKEKVKPLKVQRMAAWVVVASTTRGAQPCDSRSTASTAA